MLFEDDTDAPATPLVHDAIRPSRSGVPGETAFLTAWQALMAAARSRGDAPLAGIHSDRWSPSPHADQDDATLAATLVQWLGTNVGNGMIRHARQLMASGMNGPDAFRAAWAIKNARRYGINSDIRTIETLMVPPGARTLFDGTPHDLPALTVRQYETAEHVCAWLGTSAGQHFLDARERELEAFRRHEEIRMREANRSGRGALPGMSAEGMADYFRALRISAVGLDGRRGAA